MNFVSLCIYENEKKLGKCQRYCTPTNYKSRVIYKSRGLQHKHKPMTTIPDLEQAHETYLDLKTLKSSMTFECPTTDLIANLFS